MRELTDHTPSPTRPTSPRTVLLPALLTRLELAAYLGYSVMTIERLRIGDAKFPRPIRPTRRINGVSLRWRREEIDAWLDALSNEAKPKRTA